MQPIAPRLLASILVLSSPALPACDPPGKNAGEADPTDSQGSGGQDASASTTDSADGSETDAPAPLDPEWSLAFDPGVIITHMIRSPDGVVLVAQGDDADVLEISPTMQQLWAVSLENGLVGDLDELGNGTYVVAGSVGASVMATPTAWVVSCCAAPTSHSHPQPDGSMFIVGKPLGDALLLVAEHGSDPASFVLASLDPGPPLVDQGFGFMVIDGAVTPQGTVLLQASEGGDPDALYEMTPGGTGDWFDAGDFTRFVGRGDDLTLMKYGYDEVGIQPLAGGAEVWVSIPGLDLGNVVVARGQRIVVAHHEFEPGAGVRLTEFEDDGTIVRTVVVSNQQYAYVVPSALAIGEDGAIHLAVRESDAEGWNTVAFLHRIAAI